MNAVESTRPADCTKHYAVALNDAADTGKGLGVAQHVVLWVVADFSLSLGYSIYQLATRGAVSSAITCGG
jgi:hypothetical protein